jgi:hypothetical protein
MNYVVWWHYVIDNYICVWWMIVGQVMFIYLSISYLACLYMWMVDVILDGHVLLQVLLWDLGHHILFYLLCEYNMSYCISFSRIYTYSHTLVAPHELQNLGGVSILIYAGDVFMIIIKIRIHCIY